MISNVCATRRAALAAVAGAFVIAGGLTPVSAHRQRIALTTVRWDATAQALQVIHRLHAHDAGHFLETDPDAAVTDIKGRARLALHVEEQFRLFSTEGVPLPLKMVGAELDRNYVFVYQEMPLSQPPAALAIENGVFQDLFSDQINHVNFEMGGAVKTLVFEKGDGKKRVSFG
ncbi:MAG: DUF6702 family protein [Pseudomonadota bacterium]